jgi:threonine dehydratase
VIALSDVVAAAARIDGAAVRTPVLDHGDGVFLKGEHAQRTGAFKFRGAFNAVAQLPDGTRGVAAVSSGNHAQAVALAAKLHGLPATILVPHDILPFKRAATESHGAELVFYDRYTEDREALFPRLVAERGLAPIHPFDNLHVMAGQGTVALELLDDVLGIDTLVVPIGGGGLISGCSTVAAARGVRVVGVEPEAGDDTRRSLAAGERIRIGVPRTIADGLQSAAPGELTFPIVQRLVDAIVTVTDAEIVDAMREIEARHGVRVEPSGAVALAAVRAGRVGGGRIGVVVTGGNVGAERFAELVSANQAN